MHRIHIPCRSRRKVNEYIYVYIYAHVHNTYVSYMYMYLLMYVHIHVYQNVPVQKDTIGCRVADVLSYTLTDLASTPYQRTASSSTWRATRMTSSSVAAPQQPQTCSSLALSVTSLWRRRVGVSSRRAVERWAVTVAAVATTNDDSLQTMSSVTR